MQRWITLACLLPALLAGCAGVPPGASRCPASLGPPMLLFQVFFGRSATGRGEVSEKEWSDFVDRVITQRLPNGYTIIGVTGGWMNPDNHGTVRERSKLLLAALPENSESVGVINQIRNEYQVQFRQQRVGMTVGQVCGSF